MFRLIYASKSSPLLDGADVHSLLLHSKENNVEHGITGVLLYGQGYFLQALEGERAEINKVFQYIWNDKRHHDVRIIEAVEIDTRDFDKWSMEIIGWPDELDTSLKMILQQDLGHEELAPYEMNGHQAVLLLKKLSNIDGLLHRF